MNKKVKKIINGTIMATAVAGFFMASSMGIAKAEDKKVEKKPEVMCDGVNECKSKGQCAALDGSHACGGKNKCKGKGMIKEMTEKACTDKKGKVRKKS